MQANVPPNLLRVVDAIGRDEQLQKVFILAEAFKRVGNSSTRKAFEEHMSIAFQPGILAKPEWRVKRQRVDVWAEIARWPHNIGPFFAIGNCYVTVHTTHASCSCNL